MKPYRPFFLSFVAALTVLGLWALKQGRPDPLVQPRTSPPAERLVAVLDEDEPEFKQEEAFAPT